MVTFLCHHRQRDFFYIFYIFLFVICHMANIYMYVDRNATAVNKLQVAIKYTFDLEVRNVREQSASIFSRGFICFSHDISMADGNC